MRDIIIKKLNQIEKNENVRILHCIESGSRAWGFPSPDSDYDVRFIYVRPKDFYLRLDKTKDVIEWQLDDTFDINGWDLKKTLTLLHKCNPTIFEWNSSPIIYRTSDEWQKISSVINNYFTPKTELYHYLRLAIRNFHGYLEEENVKFKKYFYVLRPILACKWILDKATPPPMLFETLADGYLDDEVKDDVSRLLYIKMNTPEIAEGKRIDRLNEYLEKKIKEIKNIVEGMPPEKCRDWTELNEIFLSIIK